MSKHILVVGPSIPSFLQKDPSITIVHQPLITLQPLPVPQDSLSPIKHVDSIIMTSKHAVEFFYRAIAELPPSLPFFCVGDSTAQRVSSFFQNPIHIASIQTQEGLSHLILQHNPRSAFWPRSTKARRLLSRVLHKAKIQLYELPLYSPVDAQTPLILDGIDEVFFTSPSSVTAFFSRIKKLPPLSFSSIGPITAKKLKNQLAFFETKNQSSA